MKILLRTLFLMFTLAGFASFTRAQTEPKVYMISGGVLNGRAIRLPVPRYPKDADRRKIGGDVRVEVLIDERGRIYSAKAVSGHPLLRKAAEDAALRARFSPTYFGDRPVQVSGIITYTFHQRRR